MKLTLKFIEGNVQISRRFVLFDNSSTILKDDSKRLQFTTADNGSHKIWQTQKKFVCFDWSSRFYNSFQKKSNLLKPIETKAYTMTMNILCRKMVPLM